MNKNYVVSEVLDTISLMQLNKEELPELSNYEIETIAENILFTWNELGDREANFAELVREEINIYIKDIKPFL
jgi:phage terminase Nu1 subunit (DNA packaging protein)